MIVKSSHTGLLDLPPAVLVRILGLVALEEQDDTSAARLGCKALQLAGESVPRKGPLVWTAAKLQQAKEAACESHLLAFSTRVAQQWPRAVVEVQSLGGLQLLGRLICAADSLKELELRFAYEQDPPMFTPLAKPPPHLWSCFHIPKKLERLTSLSKLAIYQHHIDQYIHYSHHGPGDRLPASDLVQLSSLTALRSLTIAGAVVGTLPPAALSNLQQLTSLDLTLPVFPPPGATLPQGLEWVGQQQHLDGQHLAPLTALRRLRLADVELHLSEQQALAAWQHLEELRLVQLPDLGQILAEDIQLDDAGFWPALPLLPCLTLLEAQNLRGAPSRVLSNRLPERLASLQLRARFLKCSYSEPSLPTLPPGITALELRLDGELQSLPLSANLRRFVLVSTQPLPEWPVSAAAMVQLTGLSLYCPLGEFPAPLASLPAIEVLELADIGATGLPHELACVGSLRQLALPRFNNSLSGVPAVLGGGAASRLEHLDLRNKYDLIVDDEGLAVLQSLTALTYLSLSGVRRGVQPADAGSEVLRSLLEAPPRPPWWPQQLL